MNNTKTLRGPGGISIVLDAAEVFPDDPGNGCPALVVLPFNRGSGTYWCVSDNGEIMGRDGDIRLTKAQMTWLWAQATEVEDFVAAATAALS
jgi:hypothetical protein